MASLEAFLTDLALVFVLALARVGTLVATAPTLSESTIPLRVRALLAVSMAGVVTPMLLDHPTPRFETLAELGAAIAQEALVGLLLGLGLLVVLAGVQLTGQIVGQMSGMVLAEGADPMFTDNATVFGQVFSLVTIAVFVTLGGHAVMIDALLATFDHAPPGFASLGQASIEEFFLLVSMGFELGMRASAPLMVGLFMATLVLGLISRTLPQINAVVVGLSVNVLLTLGLMFVALGSIVWSFQQPLGTALERLVDAMATDAAAALESR